MCSVTQITDAVGITESRGVTLLEVLCNWTYIHKCLGHLRQIIPFFPTSILYIQQYSHFNYSSQLTTSVALCHLSHNRAALVRPEARLIACVMW